MIDEQHDAAQDSGAGSGEAGARLPEAARPPQRSGRQPQPRRDARHHGRNKRRAFGIVGYIGPNGSGKSAAMVFDTLPTLDGIQWNCSNPTHRHSRADYVNPQTGEVGPVTTGTRRVLSTVPLLDAETGLPHPLYDELSSAAGGWRLVLEAEHSDILLDEISGIAGSREAMGLPVAVQTALQQLRKPDNVMRWSAPSYKRADSIIRECSQAVVFARGFFPDFRKARHGDEVTGWVPNRLFKWRTFDGKDFAEFAAENALGDRKQGSKLRALRPKNVSWVWGPGSRFFASYDTFGAVSRVADYLDGGRCAHCGGRRAVPRCEC